ncbi:MAG: hypothetical protein MRERV_15c035 [Mycoplasmataceae bacterium RV_VA103A]|nr:MAG: hypothetical protein MRERV_15c035 [Mycoplasmataceae bacterium RV_VA103A]
MARTCPFVVEKGLLWNKVCKKEVGSFVTLKLKNGKQFYNEYCPEHGCRVCGHSQLKGQYQDPPKNFKTNFGEEVCSLECKNEAEKEQWEKEAKSETEAKKNVMENMGEFDDEAIREIKKIFAPFYEVIKEVRMNELRKELLREQIQPFQFRAKCGSAIEAHSLLESAEKEQWEQIYGEVYSWKDLINICQKERNFLVSLAKKYQAKEEQAQQENIPECKKCQLRREQPLTWPTGCEGWCKECVGQKQKVNNSDYRSPVNDSNKSPSSNNKNNSPENSDKKTDSFPPTDNNNDNTERERERERAKIPRTSRTSHHRANRIKMPPQPKKTSLSLF